MSAWESTRTPSFRKPASCSIIALRSSSESPILSSSAIVSSISVAWSLPKEPHGGRPRQRLRLLHTSRDSTRLGHSPHQGDPGNLGALLFVTGGEPASREGEQLGLQVCGDEVHR